MQEHALVGLADGENVTDFVGAPTLEVPQDHDRPLRLGERRKLSLDGLAGLFAENERLGSIAPSARAVRPRNLRA